MLTMFAFRISAENEDFVCQRQTVTLGPGETESSVSFDITNDLLTEGEEYFMTSISTSAERVLVTRPTAQVNIRDNDGQFTCQEFVYQ